MDKQSKNKSKKTSTPKNETAIIYIPQLENIRFDIQYDRFIAATDTTAILESGSIEEIEAFLYQTAKFFYYFKTNTKDSF